MSVTLYIGNTPADLAKDTVIALTFQVHDLSNLDSRDGNYSNQFKLPLTAKNKELLGYPNDVNSQSIIPYTKINATLFVNGLTQSGFLEIDNVSGDYVNAVFYSGNCGFFDAIGDKKLNDLDLSDFDSYWNIDGLTPNTFTTKTNTSGVVWGIIEWGVDDSNYRTLPVDTLTVNPKALRPCLYTHSIMSKIAEMAGYQLDGNFLADSRYLNEIIPIIENKPKHSQSWNNLISFQGGINSTYNIPIFTLDNIPFDIVSDPLNNYITPYYIAPANGLYNITFNYNIKVNNPLGSIPTVAIINLLLYKTTGALPTIILGQYIPTDGVSLIGNFYTEDYTALEAGTYGSINGTNIEIKQGEKIGVYVVFTGILYDGTSLDINTSSTLDVNAIDTEILYGQLFECTGNMPEITLKDFVKSLAQRYNLVLFSDTVSQIFKLTTFKSIYENNPLDWSNKINNTNQNIEFHPTYYAQNNIFKWQDESSNPDNYANGNFSVNDEVLDRNIITIQQPYGASLDVKRLQEVNVAQIPLLEFDKVTVDLGGKPTVAQPGEIILSDVRNTIYSTVTNISYKLVTVKPRILYVNHSFLNGELIYDDALTTAQNNTTEPLTFFNDEDQLYKMTFENGNDLVDVITLMDNYRELGFVLSKYKKLTAQFNLSAADVMTFDFTKPVSISGFGNFYVNKIDKFVPNKLTTVELIRL